MQEKRLVDLYLSSTLDVETINHKNDVIKNEFLEDFISKSKEHLYVDGIISCSHIEGNTIKDVLILVSKKDIAIANKKRKGEIKMRLNYTKVSDYYLPNLILKTDNNKQI